MWTGTILIAACLLTCVFAAETAIRPKPCPVGTTYKNKCNTCTCAADGRDKCSQIDCNRSQPSGGTTPVPGNKPRPGDCPTIVTPPPGSDICKNRDEKSTCTADANCPLAKKCCSNGCNVMSCRNAIYRYTK